ncbi:MAG: hypothetical protein KC478_12530 [Bacteriovoracaceae bacterium]|nr:hypothetical protein [Bacteriovoracaceae bacterium]
MKFLTSLFVLFMFFGCNDNVVEDKGLKEITTPSICPVNPYPEPPSIQFAGIDSIDNVERNRFQISWQKHDQAVSYLIYAAEHGERLKLIKTVSSEDSSVWIDGLLPDTRYNAAVKLIDERGMYDLNEHTLGVVTNNIPAYNNQKSLLFSGFSSVALKGASDILKQDPFSLSLWFKTFTRQSRNEARLITLHHGSYAGSALTVGVRKDQMFLGYRDENQDFQEVNYPIHYHDSNWHHVAVTFNGRYLSFYVDGAKVKVIEDNLSSLGSHPISIGSYTGNKKGFSGLIDEVSIWTTAMGSNDVLSMYNDGVSTNLRNHSKKNSLHIWHRFGDSEQDSENGLFDQMGNSHGSPLNIRAKDFKQESP